MQKPMLLSLTMMLFSLSACSPMPQECQDAWTKLESFAQQMGVPEAQLKMQKEKFEQEIKAMKKDEAKEQCRMQSSMMGMVGQ